MGNEAGKWMPRLSSRCCTGLFSILTLTSVRCLAAGRRGTTAVIISRPYWCRPGEGQLAANRRYLEGSEPRYYLSNAPGHPVGDLGPGGWLPVAHRNRVRDGEERCGFRRVRDAHLGRLASPCGLVPAGRGVSTAATKHTTGAAKWWPTCRVKRGYVVTERGNVGEDEERADGGLNVVSPVPAPRGLPPRSHSPDPLHESQLSQV